MLRGIYGFYLFFFVQEVFVLGMLVLPLGYLASLLIKTRILLQNRPLLGKRDAFLSSNVCNMN